MRIDRVSDILFALSQAVHDVAHASVPPDEPLPEVAMSVSNHLFSAAQFVKQTGEMLEKIGKV